MASTVCLIALKHRGRCGSGLRVTTLSSLLVVEKKRFDKSYCPLENFTNRTDYCHGVTYSLIIS